MRISERLAALLNTTLKPDPLLSADDLWSQKGAYRSVQWDLARWGAHARIGGCGRTICSWDTMTECVRYGIEINTSGAYADFEISRKSAWLNHASHSSI